MSDRRDARASDALNVSLLAGVMLLLFATTSGTAADDAPILVRLLVRGQRSVTTEAGVLVADESGDLRILDLRTGRERTFRKSQIRSLTNPATEQDVAAVTGIAPLVSWFIAEALPTRPKAGQIASVDGAVAYMNRGAAMGLREGERFDVFRGDGEDIVDPETGKVLGRTQKRIAQVEIVEVHEKLSKVRVAGEFEVEFAVGDVVRPVATEQAVAVLPLGRDSGQLIQGGVQLAEQITSGLAKNGVTVVERTDLQKVLDEQLLAGTGKFDPDTVQRVGKLLQAQAVVTGTIQVNGKDANVNVRLIDVETGKVLYATSLKARDLNTTPARTTTRSFRPARPDAGTGSVSNNSGTAVTSVLTPLRAIDGHIPQVVPAGDNGGVIGLAFSPDASLLVSGGDDQTVRLWSVQDGQLLHTMEGHASDVRAVAFSPDNQTIASGGIDKIVRLWSTDGRLLRTLNGHGSWVLGVAFSPDGQTLASCSDDHTIRLWSIANGRLVRELPGHSFRVRDVAFSSDGSTLASASGHPDKAGNDDTVRLWCVADGQLCRTLQGHSGPVSTVAFSPDGELLATGGWDRTVRIWSVEEGRLLRTIDRASPLVDVSPDGRVLATVTAGNLINIYTMPDGRLLLVLQGLSRDPETITFSPDGKLLASGSHDARILIWELPESMAE